MGKKEMELHEKVREAIGDQKVIGFVTGFSSFKKPAGTVVMTESGIVLCGRKLPGSFITDKTGIPFQQITSATYSLEMGVPYFSVTTQSGKQELVLGGGKKDVHEPAMALFEALKDKLSELASVPISITHNKGMMKEVWSFYAPPQLAVMGAKAPDSKPAESILDQIKKLAELRDAGILSPEEFENKKKELLARL